MTRTLNLRKHGAVFVLEGSPSAAALRPRRGMRSAEISVDGRTLGVRLDGHGTRVVTVDGLLRLDRRGSHLASGTEPLGWTTGRGRGGWTAAVVRGADRIDLRLPQWGGRHVEIVATGTWPELEVVCLAASFALLARRRHALVVAASVGHG